MKAPLVCLTNKLYMNVAKQPVKDPLIPEVSDLAEALCSLGKGQCLGQGAVTFSSSHPCLQLLSCSCCHVLPAMHPVTYHVDALI